VEGEALKDKAALDISGLLANGAAPDRVDTLEEVWRANVYHDAASKMHDAIKSIGCGQIQFAREVDQISQIDALYRYGTRRLSRKLALARRVLAVSDDEHRTIAVGA
jgi:hypothetical protein